jgi:hypothetical protein
MLRTTLWAFFLACSWTWCVGMFLPVLLVRNWGVWAWVVFAIPNVVGAAAMGFVIRSRETSQRILDEHRLAIAVFSLITIAFHIYFVYWFVGGRLMGPWSLVIPVAAFFIFWSPGRQRPELDSRLAPIVWLISMIAFAIVAWRDGFKIDLLPPLWPKYEALFLLPLCLFGFALCPYLDATFHRALQATGPRAPFVFSLGFGLFFLLMILFTLWYTRPIAALIYPGNAGTVSRWIVIAIGCHMSIQSAFTVSLHVRELERMRMPPKFQLAALITLFTAALLAGLVTKANLQPYLGIDGGEAGYWIFMSFYSLLFSGYVSLFLLPKTGKSFQPTRDNLIRLGLTFLVAAVLCWIAVVHRQMFLLLPGVAIPLLCGRVLRRRV